VPERGTRWAEWRNFEPTNWRAADSHSTEPDREVPGLTAALMCHGRCHRSDSSQGSPAGVASEDTKA